MYKRIELCQWGFLVGLYFGILAGCRSTAVPSLPTDAPIPASQPAVTVQATITPDTHLPPPVLTTSEPESPPLFSFTNQRPDGNRLVSGAGSLPTDTPIDIPLGGQPVWVLAVPFGKDTVWAAVLADGRVQGVQLSPSGEVMVLNLHIPDLVGFAPILSRRGSEIALPRPPTSPPTGSHPVFFNGRDLFAFGSADGRLNLIDERAVSLGDVPVQLLPDARILYDETSRLLLLTDPTDRYGHGVLGDGLEAAGITLVETAPTPKVAMTISILEPAVIEGIAPIWVDWDGNGRREIIVTQSDADQGAQIVLYDESGAQIAAGPAIGRGFRWRHQIAVAPFGPDGEMELADVLTPHIGGVVEFYRWEEEHLQIVAALSGYTSHVINSRNLDMAAAGDFDGDGRIELLLPNQARTELAAIRRTETGAETAWALPLDGVMVTNLGVVSFGDGRLLVGVGRADGTLRVWQPALSQN